MIGMRKQLEEEKERNEQEAKEKELNKAMKNEEKRSLFPKLGKGKSSDTIKASSSSSSTSSADEEKSSSSSMFSSTLNAGWAWFNKQVDYFFPACVKI